MSENGPSSTIRSVLVYLLRGMAVCLIILAVLLIYQQYRGTDSPVESTRTRVDTDRAISNRRIKSEDFNRWMTEDGAHGTSLRRDIARRSPSESVGSSDTFPESVRQRLGEDLRRGLRELAVEPSNPPEEVSVQLSGLSGDTIHLSDYRGQWVLLNFWATWCPPCREEMPALQSLAEDLPDGRFQLFTVNLEETPEKVRSFLDNQGLSLPVLMDRSGEVAATFNVRSVPVSWIISPNGRRLGRILGPRDWSGPPARTIFRDLVKVEW